ncbi:MAG: transporter substrate-binding protein [Paenibacillaceae bacterium]|nr:transporter substrate-binding protein [Paenibacillaceae bacterium]
MDPEIFANKGTANNDKGVKGLAGIVYTDWTGFFKKEGADQVKAANPNAQWSLLPTIKGPAGQFDSAYDVGSTSGLIVIPKQVEKDKNKLQKIFETLNYVSSAEGAQLVQFGIKDKHFTMEGNSLKVTDQGVKEAGYIWVYQLTGRPEAEYLSTKFDYAASVIDQSSKLNRLNIYNNFIDLPNGFNMADSQRYLFDQTLQIVYGKAPLDSVEKLAADLNSKFGLGSYLDQANKQLKELGYLK